MGRTEAERLFPILGEFKKNIMTQCYQSGSIVGWDRSCSTYRTSEAFSCHLVVWWCPVRQVMLYLLYLVESAGTDMVEVGLAAVFSHLWMQQETLGLILGTLRHSGDVLTIACARSGVHG